MNMARAQLSIEFLIYSTVMVAGLLASVKIFSVGMDKVGSGMDHAYLGEILAGVETIGSGGGSIYAFIPDGLCNSSMSGALDNYSSIYGLRISVDNSICDDAGGFETMNVYVGPNGSEIWERG
jgi:hypothetical protein